MKRPFAFIAGLALGFTAFHASAADYGALQEAEAMVKKAVAFYDKNGKDKTVAELGKNMMDLRDSGGVFILREHTGAEKHDNLIFSAGAYKPA